MTTLIDQTVEDMAHALRVLGEALIRGQTLIRVDRAEAVGNIEISYTAVLNSFHSLYDAIDGSMRPAPIDWYSNGALATILALRNARHHNKAAKIRTIYTHHRGPSPAYYLFGSTDGLSPTPLYISWDDLSEYLELPGVRLSKSAISAIRDYVKANLLAAATTGITTPVAGVVIDVMPLICNAAATILPRVASDLTLRSVEAETYVEHFQKLGVSELAWSFHQRLVIRTPSP